MSYRTQRSHYVYVTSGIYGKNYARGNVKPYGSIWRVPVFTSKTYPWAETTGEPVCVYSNVSGLDDPCIPARIRKNLWYYDSDYRLVKYVGKLGNE